MTRRMVAVDGCTACAHVVHATNEIVTIYPITPSSPIAELCDAKSAAGQKNIWGHVPVITQMQSEAGVAGALHGSLTTGAVATTISASQGLLLLIPNMYKMAGELIPTVFHIAARALATQALSIFGDHSDVMATRSTGFAMLCAKSVQEAMDFALISQAATLKSRIPFLHFFDGFRTSHEIRKIEELTMEDMRAMIDEELVTAHRTRGLTPDRPMVRGTAQNPDIYFQGRETVNQFQEATPGIVQEAMDRFAAITGRQYKLFEYYGADDAEQVVIVMGSAGETVNGTISLLNQQGAKLGLLQVRLYRPFSVEAFIGAVPKTVKSTAVLDRTKEPGAIGEPLYIDVRAALGEAMDKGIAPFSAYPLVVGGRYGIGSKDFTPAMAKAVYDNLSLPQPKNHFTVGITDDLTDSSLPVDDSFTLEEKGVYRALFYGLGSDGTVGANKSTIKIIGEETDNCAQGYFVYDSKKAGSGTVSHLRFGKEDIEDPYLLPSARFIACHHPPLLQTTDMLSAAEEGATFLLATSLPADTVWDSLPAEAQEQLIKKKMKFYIIDGVALGEELGLGRRINIIMQTAFFVISGILPQEQAIGSIKAQLYKTYKKKGEAVVQMNYGAVDKALQNIVEVKIPGKVTGRPRKEPVTANAPAFVKEVLGPMISGKGDSLPVSAMPSDGTWPSATTQYEKRNIAIHIPVWEPDICVQCGFCSFVCPHGTIRIKAFDPALLEGAPSTFKSVKASGKDFQGLNFTVQVAPEDCTGCGSCVNNCPGRKKDAEGKQIPNFHAINMHPVEPLVEAEIKNYDFFLNIPETDPSRYKLETVKGSQLVRPLFEYSSACAGCGETPYIKLLTQLFGDRLYIGNATGCSSIYGGNLPTIPYAKRADGRGPTWANSLFEDAAEFAFGMRKTVATFQSQALELLELISKSESYAGAAELIREIAAADQTTQAAIEKQRERVAMLKKVLAGDKSPGALRLFSIADYLVRKSVWGMGGDGWAYDIGYGGLDHVLASGEDINLLVLDTEVYSNTGGQVSKATPLGASAQFAEAGKRMPKKSLALISMSYGYIYVAQIAFGANHAQTVKAFMEAESYPGPSVVIAYATCVGQGIDMSKPIEAQKKAVASGHWPLFRYDPRLEAAGKNPLTLDSGEPTIPYTEYAYSENRYRTLRASNPKLSAELMEQAQKDVVRGWKYLKHLAAWSNQP
jgi:pyruvate-ferredoxin/flavodoxin oxidoreductase